MAKTPVNERIANAYEEFVGRLGVEGAKREVARRVYDDAGRFRDIGRYMKADGPAPRLPLAVALAVALEQPVDSFIDDPLVEIARELDEARRRAESLDRRLRALDKAVTEGFAQVTPTLAAVLEGVAELERRLPPEAQGKRRAS